MKLSEVTLDASILYVLQCEYVERAIPKAAGFQWNQFLRRWESDNPQHAALLKEFAGSTCPELEGVEVSPEDSGRVARAILSVQQAKPSPTTVAQEAEDEVFRVSVPQGNYLLDVKGKSMIFQVKVSRTGLQYVKTGAEGTYRGHDRGYLRLLSGSNLEEAGKRYGLETGKCWVCNRRLKDELSKLLGVGPECGTSQHAAYKAALTSFVPTLVPSIDGDL